MKAADLAACFAEKLGASPNVWWNDSRREDVVMNFVWSNYNAAFRPEIESKIRKMPAEDAKAELLKLIASVPDAGLAFMR